MEVTPDRSALRAMLPTYQCHKSVQAFKIDSVLPISPGVVRLCGVPAAGDPLKIPTADVSSFWFMRHRPRTGGWFVIYGDGYESFSPAEAFEKGYSVVG